MSYVSGHPRRPHYSNVGYGSRYDANYGNYRPEYDTHNYQGYQQPVSYAPRRRRNSHNYHSGSQVAYSSTMPQYVTSGRDHYSSNHGYSRHGPNVIMASGSSLARQATPYVSASTSRRYRAEGQRGQSIPVVSGVSYRDEVIPLSTRIRRLFGLGPRRSSTYVGRSVHIKQWGIGRYGFQSTRQYFAANRGSRSHNTAFTI